MICVFFSFLNEKNKRYKTVNFSLRAEIKACQIMFSNIRYVPSEQLTDHRHSVSPLQRVRTETNPAHTTNTAHTRINKIVIYKM